MLTPVDTKRKPQHISIDGSLDINDVPVYYSTKIDDYGIVVNNLPGTSPDICLQINDKPVVNASIPCIEVNNFLFSQNYPSNEYFILLSVKERAKAARSDDTKLEYHFEPGTYSYVNDSLDFEGLVMLILNVVFGFIFLVGISISSIFLCCGLSVTRRSASSPPSFEAMSHEFQSF